MPEDSAAVKVWRDHFKLNCSVGRKHEINLTVQDLELWKYVLKNWGFWSRGKWVSHNPMSIGKQLSEYERLERKRESGSAIAYVERV